MIHSYFAHKYPVLQSAHQSTHPDLFALSPHINPMASSETARIRQILLQPEKPRVSNSLELVTTAPLGSAILWQHSTGDYCCNTCALVTHRTRVRVLSQGFESFTPHKPRVSPKPGAQAGHCRHPIGDQRSAGWIVQRMGT